MRKWHRWISVFFGIFMLWIALTGLGSQLFALWPSPAPSAEAVAAAAPPPGFICPEGWRCMAPPPAGDMRSLVGLFHHLHSGESFGPLGTIVSILSGFALAFFAISGLWLYIQMWRNRASRGLKGGMFWK